MGKLDLDSKIYFHLVLSNIQMITSMDRTLRKRSNLSANFYLNPIIHSHINSLCSTLLWRSFSPTTDLSRALMFACCRQNQLFDNREKLDSAKRGVGYVALPPIKLNRDGPFQRGDQE